MHNARHRSDTSTWWIRPRALGALVVASAGLVVAIWVPGRNDTAEAAETRTTFADEFDGDRGAGLDATKWLLGGEPDAARQDGEGRLVLTRPMSTRIGFAESFGHAEASIKVRRAADALRAFGVVDRRGQLLRGKVEVIGRPAAPISVDDFHTYAVDWSGESVVWSLDGRPVMRLASAAADRPFGVVLNLALGDNGRRTSRMVVDFVRVTADASPPSSEPTSPPVTTAPTSAPTTAPPTTAPPTSTPPSSTPPSSTPPSSTPPKAAAWKTFTDYAAGDLVTFEGATYRVLEAHTSLPGWEPTALPNLFAKV